MRRINYKSDIPPLLLSLKVDENQITVPDCDFIVRFYIDGYEGRHYDCSHIGGVWSNCEPSEDGTKLVCYINNQRLGIGELCAEFHYISPDRRYSDGSQKSVVVIGSAELGVELVEDNGDAVTEAAIDVTLPFIYRTAYEIARDHGYTGTAEDFYSALASVVGIADAEKKRVTAEITRNANEQERIENEENRLNAESERVNAEAQRVRNEAIRGDAESDRVEQEEDRKAKFEEITGFIATVRANEGNRESNERERQANEDTRITEEAKRVAAEKKRAAEFEQQKLDLTGKIDRSGDEMGGDLIFTDNTGVSFRTSDGGAHTMFNDTDDVAKFTADNGDTFEFKQNETPNKNSSALVVSENLYNALDMTLESMGSALDGDAAYRAEAGDKIFNPDTCKIQRYNSTIGGFEDLCDPIEGKLYANKMTGYIYRWDTKAKKMVFVGGVKAYTKEEADSRFAKLDDATQIVKVKELDAYNSINTKSMWIGDEGLLLGGDGNGHLTVEQDEVITDVTLNGKLATKADKTELDTINAKVGQKVSKTDIVQNTGQSTTAVMSQKAVSDELSEMNGKVDELESEVIYDVTANNSGATFDSLSALLSNENLSTLIPTSVRHGGMSMRFIQSSDNKYVQYRLMSDTFNTNVANWQGVDDEPTAGSENLVKSGGVFDEMQGIESFAVPGVITPIATKGGYWVNNDGTYEAYDIQTTDIVRVRKGAKISVSFTTGTMTLRYGLFSSMPAADDTTSIHDRTGTSPCVITIQNDGYLALSHITSVAIEISSLGQPVDDVPTRNSGNTVKSGGVYDVIKGLADEIHSSVNWDGLSISYIKEVEISGNLFNIAKKISDDGYYISSINSDGTLIFLYNAGYRSYLIPVDGISTYSFTYGRTVVLMKDETHAVDGASVQTYTNSISSVGAKYIAFSFNNETYPESTYQVGIGSLQAEPVFKIPYLKVGTDNLEDESVNTGKLKSKAVTFDKIGFSVLGKNLFNINDHDNVIGKYISGNMFYEGDGSYNTTGYIQVEPNTTYQCSNDGETRKGVYLARFVCQYGSDKSYLSGADIQAEASIDSFTTGTNTYFIRVSAKGAYWDKYQIEEGSAPTEWEPYQHIISPQYLPKDSFGHFEGSATLAQNGTLTLPQSYSRKNLAFSALIDGTDNANLDVLIGLGHNKFRGAWLELTPTKVIVHEYTSSDATTEYTHGLTLGSSAIVSFNTGTTEATIRVISDGNVFSQNIDKGFFFGGAGFVTNKGSNSVDARLSVMLKDVTKNVWLFGDSYLSWDNPARWPYWMLQWGFKSWMSDSLPGGNSYIGYTSFINDKKIGKPTYLLWANGMNDGADTDINTPNSAWKQCIDSVIAECAELGITPILATIPSVPNIYHEGKNKWIRESGYRYVDFAAAVGANSAGVWKTGMLNSDNIHPTTLGAKALASQVLINFPEIMVE